MIKKIISLIIKYPLMTVFTLCIVAFFLIYNVRDDVLFSPVENRYLATRPSFSIDGVKDKSFMDAFESYCEEQLPFRDGFIKAKAICEEIILKCENNGIARGKEGYLFEKVTSKSGQLHKNLTAIREFCNCTDRNVFIAVAPNSFYVYEDKIPYGMPVLDEDATMRELEGLLKDTRNARIIDLNSTLKEAREDGLYYKTDHHWTSLGAYKAYLQIADAMEKTPVLLDDLTENQVDDFYGTYYAKYKGVGVPGDTLRFYDFDISKYDADGVYHEGLYDFEKLDTYDKYAMFMYGNPGKGVISCSEDESSLIILKNSYANSLIPFLTDNYGTIVTVDLRYFGGNLSEVLDEYPDGDILLLYDWSFVNEDNHFYKLVK